MFWNDNHPVVPIGSLPVDEKSSQKERRRNALTNTSVVPFFFSGNNQFESNSLVILNWNETVAKKTIWGIVSWTNLHPSRHCTEFTEFYRVLPSFTEFYRVLPSFTEFYRVLPSDPIDDAGYLPSYSIDPIALNPPTLHPAGSPFCEEKKEKKRFSRTNVRFFSFFYVFFYSTGKECGWRMEPKKKKK